MSTVVCTRQDCMVLPYVATTERKAEMFADAIDALFAPCVETEVFEDGGKWGVAVIKGMDAVDDPINNQRIVSAFILVMMFDLSEGHGDIDCIAELLKDIPPAQMALTRRARRSFRIEDKVNRIIARLDNIAATPTKEGTVYV